jgi:antitoxin HigA-1
MLPDLLKIKGIHPGAVLKRELNRRGLEGKRFALSLEEYPQTINAICNGRRNMNAGLSIKLGKAFDADECYFMQLQAFYEVERAKALSIGNLRVPDVSKFRSALFWDTDINRIDWDKQRKSVIRRVFERGNDEEIHEFIEFYGRKVVLLELRSLIAFLPSVAINAKKHLGIQL